MSLRKRTTGRQTKKRTPKRESFEEAIAKLHKKAVKTEYPADAVNLDTVKRLLEEGNRKARSFQTIELDTSTIRVQVDPKDPERRIIRGEVVKAWEYSGGTIRGTHLPSTQFPVEKLDAVSMRDEMMPFYADNCESKTKDLDEHLNLEPFRSFRENGRLYAEFKWTGLTRTTYAKEGEPEQPPRVLTSGRQIPVSPHYREDWPKGERDIKQFRTKHEGILFHGTSDIYLGDIKKYGLVPSDRPGMGATASSAWEGSQYDGIGKVGLTDHMPNAASYALHTSILAQKGGKSVILMIDRSLLSKEDLWLRKGSGAPPAKEWDYSDVLSPEKVCGYWHYEDKDWAWYSNPAYAGSLNK